jgi:hypothetical protein
MKEKLGERVERRVVVWSGGKGKKLEVNSIKVPESYPSDALYPIGPQQRKSIPHDGVTVFTAIDT